MAPTMQWRFEWMPGPRIACARTSGPVTYDGILAMVAEGMAFAQRHGARRILVDHSASEPGASTLEIYQLPPATESRGLTRDFRLAIVPPNAQDSAADFAFYENRAQNAGFRHRVFSKLNDAITWLAEETGSSSEGSAVK